jgi:hypothetical protein
MMAGTTEQVKDGDPSGATPHVFFCDLYNPLLTRASAMQRVMTSGGRACEISLRMQTPSPAVSHSAALFPDR